MTAQGPTRGDCGVVCCGNRKISISSNIHREKIGNQTVTQITDVFEDQKRIGYIYPDVAAQKKILCIKVGFEYFNFFFEGQLYKIYEIGLGENQHYFCIYHNEQTIAIICKEDLIKGKCDSYTIYALEDSFEVLLSVVTLYFDSICYPDHGERMGNTIEDDVCVTTSRELNAKFDPSFIPKVLEKERTHN